MDKNKIPDPVLETWTYAYEVEYNLWLITGCEKTNFTTGERYLKKFLLQYLNCKH